MSMPSPPEIGFVLRRARPYVDDVISDDRRTDQPGVIVGRGELLELVHGLVDVGFSEVSIDLIAIRGEQFAVVRRTWHRPDGFDLPGARSRRGTRRRRPDDAQRHVAPRGHRRRGHT